MKNGSHKLWNSLLIMLIGFVGISACFSGPLLIMDISGMRMHFPEDTLANTPFSNYVIPGIILTVFIGLYSVFVTLWLLFPGMIRFSVKSSLQLRWYAAMFAGVLLLVFITVQLILIPSRMFLQYIYLLTSLTICILCILPSVRAYYSADNIQIHKAEGDF